MGQCNVVSNIHYSVKHDISVSMDEKMKEGVDEILDTLAPTELDMLKDMANSDINVQIEKSRGDGVSGYWRERRRMVGFMVKDGRVSRGTISHEYTHYRQWKRGDLRKVVVGTFWKGVLFDTVSPYTSVQYFSWPWEQEAFYEEAKFLSRQGLRIPPRVRMAYWKGQRNGTIRLAKRAAFLAWAAYFVIGLF